MPRKIGRGISLRETTLCGCPLRGHGFATPHRYFAVPVAAAPRRCPNGKTPALFGYFLNIKKVTPSADFVISPAKAGAFRFFHTRLPLSPRRLLPFGRISLRETGLAGHRPHRGRRFAVPVTAAPRRGPNGKTPALAPVRSHFACGETGLAGHRPRLLGLPRKIARGISLRETTLCGCPLRGHGFATPHRCFAVPVTAAPRRGPNGKTPALPPFRLRTSSFSAHFSAQKCPRRAMLSHSSRRGRPFALFHRAGAAFGTLTAAAAPPPSWSRRPLHIPCPPF